MMMEKNCEFDIRFAKINPTKLKNFYNGIAKINLTKINSGLITPFKIKFTNLVLSFGFSNRLFNQTKSRKKQTPSELRFLTGCPRSTQHQVTVRRNVEP